MAQIADMTNLEARLTTLASEVESLGQILRRVHEHSSEEVSRLVDWQDEMDDFTAGLKQASTELSSFSQRWQDATHKEELLEQKEAEMRRREELLESKTAEITKGQELLEQRTADIVKREELLKQKEAEMVKREELLEMQVAEANATESMNSAAEELRNATETGSKAREALQKVLVRQNTSRFAKRGPLLSSPEKPAPKRRQTRAGSAGAAEVLANVESNELLTNTAQTFGSPTSRRRRPLTPLTGHVTAPRSGVSSPAPNPTSAPTQDLPVNPGPNTIVPQSHGNDLEVELLAAAKHVRDVWRQIEFPADWTAEDSAKMLRNFNEAHRRKGGRNNRYWPRQAMDVGSQSNVPYCLTRDMKRLGMMAPGGRCSTHESEDLCVDVFYTTDNPGEYDSEATDKRWRLEKR